MIATTALMLSVLLVIAGCGSPDVATTPLPRIEAPDDQFSPVPRRQSASGGRAACEHFHNVAVDWTDGVITASEFRTKMREVMDSALGVNETVYELARDVVAHLTDFGHPNDPELQDEFSGISSACDAVLGR